MAAVSFPSPCYIFPLNKKIDEESGEEYLTIGKGFSDTDKLEESAGMSM
jgi:hypothetical protein